MSKHFVRLILLALLFAAPSMAFKGFRNKGEAQKEMDKMYGTEDDTTMGEDWRNTYTSIVKFMDAVTSRPKDKVFVVYVVDGQLDAVKMLCSFLVRKRGAKDALALPQQYGIYPVKISQVHLECLRRYKAFILGAPGNVPFLDRMAKKGKLSVTSTKAQFRLFARPNCMTIACNKSGMYLELVRVFLRSFPDFEDECYSYFYMN